MQDQWMRDGKGFLLCYNITSRYFFWRRTAFLTLLVGQAYFR